MPFRPPRFDSRRPWLALVGGVCCAVVAYFDFRMLPQPGEPRAESVLTSRMLQPHTPVRLPSSPVSRRIARTLVTPAASVREPDEPLGLNTRDRQVERAARAISRPAPLLSARVEPTTLLRPVRPAPAAVHEAAPPATPSVALRSDAPGPLRERDDKRHAESSAAVVAAARFPSSRRSGDDPHRRERGRSHPVYAGQLPDRLHAAEREGGARGVADRRRARAGQSLRRAQVAAARLRSVRDDRQGCRGVSRVPRPLDLTCRASGRSLPAPTRPSGSSI